MMMMITAINHSRSRCRDEKMEEEKEKKKKRGRGNFCNPFSSEERIGLKKNEELAEIFVHNGGGVERELVGFCVWKNTRKGH